jgi:DNA polymerase I
MPDPTFLAYLPDPFAVGRSAFLVLPAEGEPARVEASELVGLDAPIVSIDASALIEELLRLGQSLPNTLIDFTEALKLLSGTSKKDGGERQWEPWPHLIAASPERRAISRFREAFHNAALLHPDEVTPTLEGGAKALKAAWVTVVDELKEAGELDRFFNVEVPVAQIFYNRQYRGIAVSGRRVKEAHESAKREKYQAYIRVAEQTQVSPTGMSFKNVDRYIDKTDAAYLRFAADFATIEDYFRMASEFSTFARDFVSYVRADRDLRVLSRLFARERAYPRYHPHGTVTSRVLVSDPYLQQLRRKYRQVVVADAGLGLTYLDFRQFEPGILAGLSQDKNLIEDYNSQDLYTSLASSLFGQDIVDGSRDLAKKMFLGFCYGMTKEHIAKVVAGPQSDEQEQAQVQERVVSFFGRYSALETFKSAIESQLFENGYVETALGNRRYRVRKGSLSSEERRWAISQTIQGNASLIFKEALIGIAKKFGEDVILLPMHDAILLQFEKGSVRQKAAEASVIMKEAFTARFANVKPKISVERFGEAPVAA